PVVTTFGTKCSCACWVDWKTPPRAEFDSPNTPASSRLSPCTPRPPLLAPQTPVPSPSMGFSLGSGNGKGTPAGIDRRLRLMHEHPVRLNVVYKTGTQR